MRLQSITAHLAALSDPTRLRVLALLFHRQHPDWPVSELVQVLQLPQPTVSRHLGNLRKNGLVRQEKQGKQRLYRLVDAQHPLHRATLSALEEFVMGSPEVQHDIRRADEAGQKKTGQMDQKASIQLPMNEPQHTSAVFHALANPGRRALLDAIGQQPGCALHQVSSVVSMTRQAVQQHLAVLEDAGLIHSIRDGRVRHLYPNAIPLQQLYERWSDPRDRGLAAAMTAVQHTVEKEREP